MYFVYNVTIRRILKCHPMKVTSDCPRADLERFVCCSQIGSVLAFSQICDKYGNTTYLAARAGEDNAASVAPAPTS